MITQKQLDEIDNKLTQIQKILENKTPYNTQLKHDINNISNTLEEIRDNNPENYYNEVNKTLLNIVCSIKDLTKNISDNTIILQECLLTNININKAIDEKISDIHKNIAKTNTPQTTEKLDNLLKNQEYLAELLKKNNILTEKITKKEDNTFLNEKLNDLLKSQTDISKLLTTNNETCQIIAKQDNTTLYDKLDKMITTQTSMNHLLNENNRSTEIMARQDNTLINEKIDEIIENQKTITQILEKNKNITKITTEEEILGDKYQKYIRKEKNQYIVHREFGGNDLNFATCKTMDEAKIICEKLEKEGWPMVRDSVDE